MKNFGFWLKSQKSFPSRGNFLQKTSSVWQMKYVLRSHKKLTRVKCVSWWFVISTQKYPKFVFTTTPHSRFLLPHAWKKCIHYAQARSSVFLYCTNVPITYNIYRKGPHHIFHLENCYFLFFNEFYDFIFWIITRLLNQNYYFRWVIVRVVQYLSMLCLYKIKQQAVTVQTNKQPKVT